MEEYGTKIAVIQARKHYVPEKNSRKTILIDITRTPNEPQNEFAMQHYRRVENSLYGKGLLKLRAYPIHV